MLYLSQRDPQWASVRLGASNLTMGRYGCTTTCISMLSSYFGNYKTPPSIAKNRTWYTPDGLVIWANIKIANMIFVGRVRQFDERLANEYLRDPNKAVMFEVNNGQHWVVAIKKKLIGSDYVAVDPWDGRQCNVLQKYHNITGMALWKSK